MKYLLIALCAIIALASAKDAMDQFIEYQHAYGKVYKTSDEFNMRFEIFKYNLIQAEKLNAASPKTSYGVTKFMDLTNDEFRVYLGYNRPASQEGPVAKELPIRPLPSTFDWRNTPGVLTPVYNQGQCGSCWAFSTTENIESQWALAKHPLKSLAVQQIVSCDTTDDGCGGGNPPTAYQYVMSAGGMEPWSDYPYTATNGYCTFEKSDVIMDITNWNYVTQSGSSTQMMNYLYSKGPLSVCVDASTWQYYTGGIIMSGTCGTSLDHCVMITGYGDSNGTPFWYVRNSWGTDWGQTGYLQVERGSNTCGISEEVTSALIN